MKVKRGLAVVLLLGLLLNMAGCADRERDNALKTAERKAVRTPDDIWERYGEEVTLNVVNREFPTYRFRDGDDYDHNPWYRQYKKVFNIKVKNQWVSPDYATKLNLSIAKGEIPDVFAVNVRQLKELWQQELIWDMSEVFEKNASPLLKEIMTQNSDIVRTAKIDGKLCGIPQLSLGFQDDVDALWIRKDWREEAGFSGDDIRTVDDFKRLVQAVRKKHGTFGMAETNTLNSLYSFAPAWGAYPEIWVRQPDGTIGYGTIQPEMKDAVGQYAQWYKEGVLDQDFMNTDSAERIEKLLDEDAGIAVAGGELAWGLGSGSVKMGLDKCFEAYPVPTVSGEPVKAAVKFENYGYIVVSKKCPNPDAVIRLLNYYVYFMDELGTGEGPEVEPDIIEYMGDLRNIPGALRVFNPETELKRTKKIINHIDQGSAADTSSWGADAGIYKAVCDVLEKNDFEHGAEYLIYGSERSAYGVGMEAVENDEIVKDQAWGPETELMLRTGSALDSLLLEGITKIITGEQPLGYFDTVVSDWKKAGGDELTKEINELYGE